MRIRVFIGMGYGVCVWGMCIRVFILVCRYGIWGMRIRVLVGMGIRFGTIFPRGGKILEILVP